MILSNVDIIKAFDIGRLKIEPRPPLDPLDSPFNTSSIDLHLHHEIRIPREELPIAIDLRRGSFADLHTEGNYLVREIREDEEWTLRPNRFVLGRTIESVEFPEVDGHLPLAARVEGRSRFARCGLLVHFTAPTIHARFRGPITLELINLGPYPIQLWRKVSICQLILEEVSSNPALSKSDYRGQKGPGGRS